MLGLMSSPQRPEATPAWRTSIALTRNALLAIIPFARTSRSRDGSIEIYQRKPATALQLILHAARAQ